MEVSESVRVIAAHLNEGDEIPIAVFPAAIPYFLVRLSAICVETHGLDVVKEFVLRAIALGFNTAPDIAAFLGIQVDEIANELSLSNEQFFVSVSEPRGSYRLLEKGIAAISENGLRKVTEREVACSINGVSRKIDLAAGELLPKRKIPTGTLVLPAVPARAPKVEELDIAGVKAAVLSARSSLFRSIELSRLGRVVRASSMFLLGHLVLRRGIHSVPIVCVNEAADSDLARILGAHPALQSVKGMVERNEKILRRQVSQLFPNLKSVGLPESSSVRLALTRYVAFGDSSEQTRKQAGFDFLAAADELLKRSHWIGDSEWHVVLAHALLRARVRLVIVPPERLEIFQGTALALMMGAASRGVNVEVRLTAQRASAVHRDADLRQVLKQIRIHEVSYSGERCGLICDDSYLVLGATRLDTCSMGSFTTFFGVLSVAERHPEEVLSTFTSQSSDVAVTFKASQRRRNS